MARYTASGAFVIATSMATARADPRAVENIPAADEKGDTELPLPYEPWTGPGPVPPPSPHSDEAASLPLARAREVPRRPIELSASLLAVLPSCGAGSVDSRGCVSVQAGGGADAALLYRVSPFFAVGVEGVLSGFSQQEAEPLQSAGGRARFGGVLGRVYFAESGRWEPHVGLTLGVGSLVLRAAGSAAGTTTGVGGRVSGGVDVWVGSHVRLGPVASFAHFVAFSEQDCRGSVCNAERPAYGRLRGFATLGLRLTASFGDAL